MKLLLICLVVPFLYLNTIAQDVVLDKDVEDQYKEEKGPNMRKYSHFYEGIGTVMPYNNVTGARVEPGRSFEFIFGYRYKLKLLSFYAIGFDINNRWVKYSVKSESIPVDLITNPLSQASLTDKLNLGLSSLGGEIYNRINIGRRGNVLGNYLDFGIRGELNYSRKLMIIKTPANGDYYEGSREVQKRLNFIEKFSTLVTARIGINKVSIYGNYRISDIIASGYLTPELPPLTAGVQFAF